MSERMADDVTVDGLRTMFRGLSAWRSLFDQYGPDLQMVRDEHGVDWDLLEVEKFYHLSQERLTTRQAQAIRYFLVDNLREEDVAVAMVIRPTNPIGMYATEGLKRLIVVLHEEWLVI